jgi:uncharacterized protein (DUF433 family)
MDWKDRIVTSQEVCGGRPRIKGTRISVEFLLGLFAEGWGETEILENYPFLAPEDIRAALAFAQEIIKDESYLLPESVG